MEDDYLTLGLYGKLEKKFHSNLNTSYPYTENTILITCTHSWSMAYTTVLLHHLTKWSLWKLYKYSFFLCLSFEYGISWMWLQMTKNIID